MFLVVLHFRWLWMTQNNPNNFLFVECFHSVLPPKWHDVASVRWGDESESIQNSKFSLLILRFEFVADALSPSRVYDTKNFQFSSTGICIMSTQHTLVVIRRMDEWRLVPPKYLYTHFSNFCCSCTCWNTNTRIYLRRERALIYLCIRTTNCTMMKKKKRSFWWWTNICAEKVKSHKISTSNYFAHKLFAHYEKENIENNARLDEHVETFKFVSDDEYRI